MFYDDIKLVTEIVNKYGLVRPFFDLGGLENTGCVDYDLTISSGKQEDRFVVLNQKRPFDHIDKDYKILNPDNDDPLIENLPSEYENSIGTGVCLNVIEHVLNPFEVFKSFFKIIKDEGFLIVETVFSFPYHPSPQDFWRYSPECLNYLGKSAGFNVLEYNWRMTILADKGIKSHLGEPQEIRSVYVVLAKDNFISKPLENPIAVPTYKKAEITTT